MRHLLQSRVISLHPSVPGPSDPLSVYLAVFGHAVSAVLVHEVNKTQKPVYYVSRVLHDFETRYAGIEKFALALVIASRRLRPSSRDYSFNRPEDI